MKCILTKLILIQIVTLAVCGCHSPLQSQRFFAKSVQKEPMMDVLHQTPLYTVYFDHGLQRCVLHSAYTWGESGGGTGGTGLGVSVFNCNPAALKKHVQSLRKQINDGVEKFALPGAKPIQRRPSQQTQTVTPAKPAPSLVVPPPAPTPAPVTSPHPNAQPAAPPVVPATPGEPEKKEVPPIGVPAPPATTTGAPMPGANSPVPAAVSKPAAKPMQPIAGP